MSKKDGLDVVLSNQNLTASDWEGLVEILDVDYNYQQIKYDDNKLCEFFNQEIRHLYGHTIANIFRDCYEPDYIEVLKGCAEKLKITIKEHNSEEEIENKIIIEVIEIAKEKIIKEKGIEAWKQIEKEVEAEINKLIDEGKIPAEVAENLKQLRGPAMIAAIVGGRLAGFALYIVANQIFFALARFLGLRIGVAVAGPIIGKTLAFLLGPAGWLLAGLLVVFDLGNTNWKKVIPAVVLIATYRKKILYLN